MYKGENMKNPAGKKWMAVMLSFGLAIAGWTAVPAGAEEEEIRAEGIEIPEAESPEIEIPETEIAEASETILPDESLQETKSETEAVVSEAEASESEAEAVVSEAEASEAEEELLAAPEEETNPSVLYQTHVQTYGWQEFVQDGEMAGTSGESKRLEGVRIRVDGDSELGVSYCTHVQTYGWQDYVQDGEMAGTSGESKRLEAIRIRLTGNDADKYDIYYCVHVQSYGWLNWAKNDEISGTAGLSRRLEGLCVRILPKGSEAPAPLGTRSTAAVYGSVSYQTHVQSYGWQNFVSDGAMAGTTGQSKRLEALRILLSDTIVPGAVRYRSHVQTYGWENGYQMNGSISGTSGQSKRLEAVEIFLEGEVAEVFDIWYRTHVQSYGWTGWAKNGEPCGSEGCSYRLEGLEIRLTVKGAAAPGSTDNPIYRKRKEPSVNEILIAKANQYISDYTNDGMSRETKLRVCFDSFGSLVEKNPWIPHYRGIDWVQKYAGSLFDTRSGNCLSYAAAFCYIGKALGYDPVYGCNSGGHGWAEIEGLIYDPEWQLHNAGNYYGITYDTWTNQNYRNAIDWSVDWMRVKV